MKRLFEFSGGKTNFLFKWDRKHSHEMREMAIVSRSLVFEGVCHVYACFLPAVLSHIQSVPQSIDSADPDRPFAVLILEVEQQVRDFLHSQRAHKCTEKTTTE